MAMKTVWSYQEVAQANKLLGNVCKTSVILVTVSRLKEYNTRLD